MFCPGRTKIYLHTYPTSTVSVGLGETVILLMMALHWYNLLDQAFVQRLVISHWCLYKRNCEKILKRCRC